MVNTKLLCDYPFTHFEVNNPNGDVMMCCNHPLVLGNVNEQSIEEIWNGKKYQEVRQKFLEGKIFDICSPECPVLQEWKDYEKLDWYKKLSKDSSVFKNALLNDNEIEQRKIILTSKPRWIRFSTSYRCNLKCYHCFQAQDRMKKDILPNTFFSDLKDNYLDTLQVIFFYGGEPFIEKQNIELLKFIANKNYLLKNFIVSNGTILNETLKNILYKLNYGLISLSVDSISKELYEELRYPAKWEAVYKNIIFFANLINNKNGIMHLGITINKLNQSELAAYIEFANKLNAVPFFQLAHNTFNSKIYQKKYEIYSKSDFINLNKILVQLKKNIEFSNLKLTLRNINSLIKFSDKIINEKIITNRLKKFIKSKSSIIMGFFR